MSVKVLGNGGKVSSKDAEAALDARPVGTYCLRFSLSTVGGYGLSVRIDGPKKVKHFLITLTDDKYHIQQGPRFDDVPDLIKYYRKHQGVVVNLTENVVDLIATENPAGGDIPPPRPPKSKVRPSYELSAPIGSVMIPPSDLKLGKELGEGQFGKVNQATWICEGGPREVAVKTIRTDSLSDEQIQEQQQEANMMVQMKHENVAEMLGVSRLNGLAIIVELVPFGQLNVYLMIHRYDLNIMNLFNYSKQIASGMKYMSSKKIVHRDLAARNVLVHSKNLVKICDFGLSRSTKQKEYYRSSRKGKWPIKWYAPECLFQSVFSSASDIWSFGVTCWEIFSWGKKPFWGLNARQVVVAISEGIRLPKPEDCPSKVFNVISSCWEEDVNDRPDFRQILEMLESVRSVIEYSLANANNYSTFQSFKREDFGQVIKEQKFYAIQPTDIEEVQAEEGEEKEAKMKRRPPPPLPTQSKLLIAMSQLVADGVNTMDTSVDLNGLLRTAAGSELPVAITALDTKRINSELLMNEVKMLSPLQNKWVTRIHGLVDACEHPKGYMLLITQYLAYGPLDMYLRRQPGQPQIQLMYCTQISAGLKFLHENNVVHRNLSCNNVHVENGASVKIADFGLSRVMERDASYYRSQKNGKFLLKWLAPEVLLNSKFSPKSDSWAFGVTMWEVLSNGVEPYDKLSGHDVLKLIHNGDRLAIPEAFTDTNHQVVKQCLEQCWQWDPDQRISVGEVYTLFSKQFPEVPSFNNAEPPPVPRRTSYSGATY